MYNTHSIILPGQDKKTPPTKNKIKYTDVYTLYTIILSEAEHNRVIRQS